MIEIKNLTIQFNRQPPVVEEMSLTVPEGGRTIILGESGSGKSVTLAAILGILPSDAAVRGSIKIGGAEMLGLRERELRKIRGKVIGYIPQGSGNGMNPLMTVGEQVSEPLVEHSGLKKGEALQKAKAWMERLGLTPDASRQTGKGIPPYPERRHAPARPHGNGRSRRRENPFGR